MCVDKSFVHYLKHVRDFIITIKENDCKKIECNGSFRAFTKEWELCQTKNSTL